MIPVTAMLLELLDATKVYKGDSRAADRITMRIAATVTRPTSRRALFDGADTAATVAVA